MSERNIPSWVAEEDESPVSERGCNNCGMPTDGGHDLCAACEDNGEF